WTCVQFQDWLTLNFPQVMAYLDTQRSEIIHEGKAISDFDPGWLLCYRETGWSRKLSVYSENRHPSGREVFNHASHTARPGTAARYLYLTTRLEVPVDVLLSWASGGVSLLPSLGKGKGKSRAYTAFEELGSGDDDLDDDLDQPTRGYKRRRSPTPDPSSDPESPPPPRKYVTRLAVARAKAAATSQKASASKKRRVALDNDDDDVEIVEAELSQPTPSSPILAPTHPTASTSTLSSAPLTTRPSFKLDPLLPDPWSTESPIYSFRPKPHGV
ncbi:hypothetical protein BDN72DRAFT_851863, partial [Pluteus cervinus]